MRVTTLAGHPIPTGVLSADEFHVFISRCRDNRLNNAVGIDVRAAPREVDSRASRPVVRSCRPTPGCVRQHVSPVRTLTGESHEERR